MCMCDILQEHSISNTVVLGIEMMKEEPGIPKTDDATTVAGHVGKVLRHKIGNNESV